MDADLFAPKRSRMMLRLQAPRGAELRDLLQKIVVRVEEERKPRRKRIDLQTRCDRRFDIGDGVGERERNFLDRPSSPPRGCDSR